MQATGAEHLYKRTETKKVIMSMNQTTASGDRLTMLCGSGEQAVTQRQADSWLRQRQAASQVHQSTNRALAS